jgi:fructosamine-3-kinase
LFQHADLSGIRPEAEVLADIVRGAGVALDAGSARSQAGGSIHSSWQLVDRNGHPWFVKLCPAAQADMLEAEADGLSAIAATATIRVPEFHGAGRTEHTAWLLLEYIPMHSGSSAASGGSAAAKSLGRGLAEMHKALGDAHGWHRQNVIGLTPQINEPEESWPVFFRDRRLAYQFRLAAHNGYGGRLGEQGEALLQSVDMLLTGHEPMASLLHGDLWGGNWGISQAGDPVIFDPAVYYGDRETDIAMTRLFGGFGEDFYRAYNAALPLADGFEIRAELYNLYHVLNHLNLFGGVYLGQAHATINRLLAANGR